MDDARCLGQLGHSEEREGPHFQELFSQGKVPTSPEATGVKIK